MAYRFLSRLVLRLVCPSRMASCLYSLRFVNRLVLLVNSPGGSLSRLAWRSVAPSRSLFLGVLSYPAHLVPSRPSSRWGVSSSSPYSRFARRLVGRSVFFVSRLILFVLVSLARCVLWPWGRAAARLVLASWLRASFPVCHPSLWGGAMAGWACRSTIRGTHRFHQLDFSISVGMK